MQRFTNDEYSIDQDRLSEATTSYCANETFFTVIIFPIRFNLILNLRFTCVLLPKRMLDFEDGLFNSCSELLKLVFKCSDFSSYSETLVI